MTVIALTGLTLTALKHLDSDEHTNVVGLDDGDYDYSDTTDAPTRVNPKFNFYEVADRNQSTEKSVVKRSTNDEIQYSIGELNRSMIDETKREKVKQVHDGSRSTDKRFLALNLVIDRFISSICLFLLEPDDDTCLEQLQAVRLGQERAEAHLEACSHRQHLRSLRSWCFDRRLAGHALHHGNEAGVR